MDTISAKRSRNAVKQIEYSKHATRDVKRQTSLKTLSLVKIVKKYTPHLYDQAN